MDHTKDKNKSELYKIHTKLGEFPDFVKNASISEEEDVKFLPSTAFASPLQRLYPIHTKEDTWLSAAYFEKSASKDPQTQKALEDACEFWNIEMPTFPEEKEASGDIEIEYKLGEGPSQSVFVSNDKQLMKVAEDVLNSSDRYPWDTRRDVARQVLKAAPTINATFKAPMKTMLEKVSGYGVGDLDSAVRAVTYREARIRDSHPELGEKLLVLKGLVKEGSKDGLLSPSLTEKVARSLDLIDRLSDLHGNYSGEVQPPENLFRITPSEMETFNNQSIKLASDVYVSRGDLDKAKIRHFLTDTLGEKVAADADLGEYIENASPRTKQLVQDHLEYQLGG
jgi:hypothetical protein